LAIAARVAETHPAESSYCWPEQSFRKLGSGGMFVAGFCGGRIPLVTVLAAGTAGAEGDRGTVVLVGVGAGIEGAA